MNKVYLWVVAVVGLVLAPSSIRAERIDVWYDTLLQPIQFSTIDVVAAISATLRAWERNGNGQITFNFRGITNSRPANSPRRIYIRWISNPGFCGTACGFGLNCGGNIGADGDITLTIPTAANRLNPRWSPVTSPLNGCNSLQGVLTHEMGHILKAVNNNVGHVAGTVLEINQGAGAGLRNRHLWTNDRYGIVWGAPGISQNVLQQIGGTGTTSTYWGPQSLLHDAPLSHGPGRNCPSEGYMTAFAIDTPYLGMRVQFGNGTTWTRTVTRYYTSSEPFFTQHRPCVVTDIDGNHVYLAWTSSFEWSPIVGDGLSGAREVFVSESHDGGHTFGVPYLLPDALTRNGLSCAFDRVNGRVVLTYQGAGEDGIWVAHRPASASGSAHWTTFQQVIGGPFATTAPTTPDIPYVAFDVFGSSPHGFLSWYDNQRMVLLTAPISFSGGAYDLSGTPAIVTIPSPPPSPPWPLPPAGFDASLVLRSTPVVMFEGSADLGLSVDFSPTLQQQVRWFGLRTNGSPAIGVVTDSTTYPYGVRVRYTGAASNRCFVASSYIGSANAFN